MGLIMICGSGAGDFFGDVARDVGCDFEGEFSNRRVAEIPKRLKIVRII